MIDIALDKEHEDLVVIMVRCVLDVVVEVKIQRRDCAHEHDQRDQISVLIAHICLLFRGIHIRVMRVGILDILRDDHLVFFVAHPHPEVLIIEQLRDTRNVVLQFLDIRDVRVVLLVVVTVDFKEDVIDLLLHKIRQCDNVLIDLCVQGRKKRLVLVEVCKVQLDGLLTSVSYLQDIQTVF